MITTALLALALIAGTDDPPKAKPAPAPAAEKLQTDEGWKDLKKDDLKKLKENNIFSPPKEKKVAPPPVVKKDDPPKADDKKPQKMLSVTGFYKDDTENCYKVIIEHRKLDGDSYTFYDVKASKAGDDFAGGKIVEIAIDSFSYQVGDQKKSCKAGDQVAVEAAANEPGTDAKPGGAKTPDEKTMEQKREEMRRRHNKKFDSGEAPDPDAQKKK